MNERERRGVDNKVELRGNADTPTIAGYAAMFNEQTTIGGMFREQIAPGAFADAVKRDDVRALYNHDTNILLGRTKSGTLKLAEDARGLFYEVVLNTDDPQAMAVRSRILRGDVDGSSFGFIVDEDSWEQPAKGTRDLPLRTIRKVSLFDVSPVTFPAYEATSVSARSKEQAESVAAADLAKRAEADVRDREELRKALDAAKAWRQ